MNAKKTFLTAGLAVFTTLALAQSFSIDRFAIAGGGGTSTGGAYALAGTIGQHDAGPPSLIGGGFTLTGGFWGASQTPAPAGSVIIKVWVVGGDVHLRFTGIPGRIYYVDRAHSLPHPGPWPERLAAIAMPIDGVVEFVDTTAFPFHQSFYRTSTD